MSAERCYNCQFMNNNNQANITSAARAGKAICKLGIDTHAHSITVSRQIEGSKPQPAQKFAADKFLPWVRKQLESYEVISCYEAGPTGFWLHRELARLGVTNYVVAPTCLDSRGKGVNTDKTDAAELLVRLDRYVAGANKAFSVVRVPTVEQERKRLVTRHREQLQKQRLSFAAQGRMLLLGQGYRQKNSWWKKKGWEPLQSQLPDWLVEHLASFVRLIENVNQELSTLEKQIREEAPKCLPVGMGGLTHEILEREVKDWNNFKSRRGIGS